MLSNNIPCLLYLFSLTDGIPPALATAWEESTREHEHDQEKEVEYSVLAEKVPDLLTGDTSSRKKDVRSAEEEKEKKEFDNKPSATTAVIDNSPKTESRNKVASKRKAKVEVESADKMSSLEKMGENAQKKARVEDESVSSKQKDTSDDASQVSPDDPYETETTTDAKEANNFSFEIMNIASAFQSTLEPKQAKKRGRKQNPLNAALDEHDKMIEADADKKEEAVSVKKSESASQSDSSPSLDSSSSSSSSSGSSSDSDSEEEEEEEEEKDNKTDGNGTTEMRN